MQEEQGGELREWSLGFLGRMMVRQPQVASSRPAPFSSSQRFLCHRYHPAANFTLLSPPHLGGGLQSQPHHPLARKQASGLSPGPERNEQWRCRRGSWRLEACRSQAQCCVSQAAESARFWCRHCPGSLGGWASLWVNQR